MDFGAYGRDRRPSDAVVLVSWVLFTCKQHLSHPFSSRNQSRWAEQCPPRQGALRQGKVSALKNRVNELAAKAEKPILLQIEVKNIIERMHLSLALPNELESLDAEPWPSRRGESA
jgi:hypothetical protein